MGYHAFECILHGATNMVCRTCTPDENSDLRKRLADLQEHHDNWILGPHKEVIERAEKAEAEAKDLMNDLHQAAHDIDSIKHVLGKMDAKREKAEQRVLALERELAEAKTGKVNCAKIGVRVMKERDIARADAGNVRNLSTKLLAELGCDVAGKINPPQLGRIANAIVNLKQALAAAQEDKP